MPPASIPKEKMGEGNRYNKEQIPNYGQERRGREILQTVSEAISNEIDDKVWVFSAQSNWSKHARA